MKHIPSGRTQDLDLLTFEEATQLLVSVLDDPRIQAVCEYLEQTGTAEWTISYNGAQLDATVSDDALVLSVLRGMTKRFTYTWLNKGDYPNQLKLTIRSV